MIGIGVLRMEMMVVAVVVALDGQGRFWSDCELSRLRMQRI